MPNIRFEKERRELRGRKVKGAPIADGRGMIHSGVPSAKSRDRSCSGQPLPKQRTLHLAADTKGRRKNKMAAIERNRRGGIGHFRWPVSVVDACRNENKVNMSYDKDNSVSESCEKTSLKNEREIENANEKENIDTVNKVYEVKDVDVGEVMMNKEERKVEYATQKTCAQLMIGESDIEEDVSKHDIISSAGEVIVDGKVLNDFNAEGSDRDFARLPENDSMEENEMKVIEVHDDYTKYEVKAEIVQSDKTEVSDCPNDVHCVENELKNEVAETSSDNLPHCLKVALLLESDDENEISDSSDNEGYMNTDKNEYTNFPYCSKVEYLSNSDGEEKSSDDSSEDEFSGVNESEYTFTERGYEKISDIFPKQDTGSRTGPKPNELFSNVTQGHNLQEPPDTILGQALTNVLKECESQEQKEPHDNTILGQVLTNVLSKCEAQEQKEPPDKIIAEQEMLYLAKDFEIPKPKKPPDETKRWQDLNRLVKDVESRRPKKPPDLVTVL